MSGHWVMIYGPVCTSRIAYRKQGKDNLYPQDGGADLGPAGVFGGGSSAATPRPSWWPRSAIGSGPGQRAGRDPSGQTAIRGARGRRGLVDFGAFDAARRPVPRVPATPGCCPPPTGGLPACPLAGAVAGDREGRRGPRGCCCGLRAGPITPGELRKSRKWMAQLAAVADIPPAPRTSGDILEATSAPEAAARPRTPGRKRRARRCSPPSASPPGKSSPRRSPKRTAATPHHLRPWFAVVDGNNHQIETITTLAADYQVKVPILIDLIHVTQYLWKAANSFFYTGDPEALGLGQGPGGQDPGLEAPRRPRRVSAAAPVPTATARPSAPAPTNARTTSNTSRTTWTTPPSSPPDGPWLAVSSRARANALDRQGENGSHWCEMGPAWCLKPSSSSAPCTALVTSGDYLDYRFQQEKHRNHDSRYQHAQELAGLPP